MYRALFAAAAAVALSLGAAPWAPAAAQDGPEAGGYYVEARGGVAFLKDSDLNDSTGELASIGISELRSNLETGFAVEAAAGYAYSPALRGEIALGYRRNDLDGFSAAVAGAPATVEVDGHVDAITLMGNVYYDLRVHPDIVPFVGGGVGPAGVVFEVQNSNDFDVVFAWQLIGGIGYQITDDFFLSLRYTYFSAQKPELDGLEADYDSHNVMFGIRYDF